MSVSRVAKELGISRTLIYRAIADGTIKALPQSPLYRGRGPRLIPAVEVEKLRPHEAQ